MKTSKITTIIAALNLVLFMSVSSVAHPFAGITGDIAKKSVKNQIESVKSTIVDRASTIDSENEFRNLRFDVNKFNTESAISELPLNSLNYLRFDVSNYTVGIASEITELPLMNQFDYLRFDVNNFSNDSDLSEMPASEFDYLRFDVSNYLNANSDAIDELTVN